jgi:iron complex transport system substrate-binding protein
MRAFVFASALNALLAGLALAAPPQRVASLNLCTDELLLMIARPEQILSVTHLSQQEAETPLWRDARRYRRNDGSLLSVAALRPDLVLTMGGGARDRGRIAERLGVQALDLPYPQSIEDVEKAIVTVGKALGQEDRGRFFLAEIEALRRAAPRPGIEAVWMGGGGRSVSATGLAAQWMALGGFRQREVAGERLSLENLLVRPPALILRSDYRSGQYSSEQKWLSHPLARRVRGARIIPTDGRRWTCMGPLMISETKRLRKAQSK